MVCNARSSTSLPTNPNLINGQILGISTRSSAGLDFLEDGNNLAFASAANRAGGCV